jgi:hypothetical protein
MKKCMHALVLTEEEMPYVPKYTKRIELDSISFQRLCVEKGYALTELAESAPGCCERTAAPCIVAGTGASDSGKFVMALSRDFCDSRQIIHIVRKIRRLGLSGRHDSTAAVPNLPRLLCRLAKRNR